MDFRTAAAAGFERLYSLYTTTDFGQLNAFWFAGNSLHTCLDYLIVSGEPDTPGRGVLQKGYQWYLDLTRSNPNWWRDDYGWWGIALLTAAQNRARLGYGDPSWNPLFAKIQASVDDCWNLMNANWDESFYTPAVPIQGGVWNTRAAGEMSGRNSVTNELFWILSARLNRPRALDERKWFLQWVSFFGTPQTGILDPKGLVLERPTGNPYDPSWYWTGDQGLFLAGLAAAGWNNPPDIGRAVLDNLLDPEGVVHEQFLGMFGGAFDRDYATGKGVLLRYMGEVNQGVPGQPYSSFIQTNARAVWCHRVDASVNQFGFNWNPAYPPEKEPVMDNVWPLVLQTAGQDALNAALRIAPAASFDC